MVVLGCFGYLQKGIVCSMVGLKGAVGELGARFAIPSISVVLEVWAGRPGVCVWCRRGLLLA